MFPAGCRKGSVRINKDGCPVCVSEGMLSFYPFTLHMIVADLNCFQRGCCIDRQYQSDFGVFSGIFQKNLETGTTQYGVMTTEYTLMI